MKVESILSAHAKHVLKERKISEEWVWRTIEDAEKEQEGDDGNIHFFRSIGEREGRILHVVVNPKSSPRTVVTAFFDRRERKHL
jgi:hypothetical protein